MAAQLAHEVRNPLGAITLSLDLLTHEFESATGATGRSFQEGFDLVKENTRGGEAYRACDHGLPRTRTTEAIATRSA